MRLSKDSSVAAETPIGAVFITSCSKIFSVSDGYWIEFVLIFTLHAYLSGTLRQNMLHSLLWQISGEGLALGLVSNHQRLGLVSSRQVGSLVSVSSR